MLWKVLRPCFIIFRFNVKIVILDKVYIHGPCGSKTLAGVLLARFEKVSHVTYLRNRTNMSSAYTVRLGSGMFST